MPNVPTMAHGIAVGLVNADKACASHHAVDVLPLVPVIATTDNFSEGWAKNSAAIAPAAL